MVVVVDGAPVELDELPVPEHNNYHLIEHLMSMQNLVIYLLFLDYFHCKLMLSTLRQLQ